MSATATSLNVILPREGFAREAAERAVAQSGLPEAVAAVAGGPFGHTSGGLALLEALVDAADVGIAAAEALEALVLGEAKADPDPSRWPGRPRPSTTSP